MGLLCQHLKEMQNEGRKGKERRGRIERSRAATGLAEKGFMSRTLGLRLRECVRARTPILHEKGAVGKALLASIF